MQFKEDFRFPVEDSFTTASSQSFHYPTITTSSHGPSAFDRLTPDSRRSSPTGVKVEYDSGYPVELTPPHGASANYILGTSRMEPELSFTETLPSTPMKRYDSFSSTYDMVDMNLSQHNIHTLTPSNSFGIYNVSPHAMDDSTPTALMMTPQSSILMTPTRSSMSGSELAESPSPWSGEIHDSPNHFFGQPHMMNDMEPLHLNPSASFMMSSDSLPCTASPEALQRQMLILQAQQRSEELHRVQHDRSRALMRVQHRRQHKRAGETDQHPPVEVVGAAKHKCEYPGCSKAFRRMEHLKRHKQTTHGEGPNRFRCEFCKKDQFNRQDNLNNHRKLHARPNSRNRGVEFMPEAVPIIEEEERSRKKRQPPKTSKGSSGWLTPDECF
ncbi:hypothetical protein NLU13_6215 [Sarocladium strictum]|uniref:C2H2-type domain-containing protein n=1 Tax=Sarocladium strictum TaxID=5046 RepID=A0AA39GFH3_SARSR|nr:hypothetical protein NLU13_6215 [Sarocladium strictum]